MSIAEKLQIIAENEKRVYEAGQLAPLKNSKYMNTEKSGTSIAITDISPLEHELDIQLSSDTITDFSSVSIEKSCKNLIKLPDYEKTNYGMTVNIKNGVATIKGAFSGGGDAKTLNRYFNWDTNYANYVSIKKEYSFELPKGTYTLSLNEEVNELNCGFSIGIAHGAIGHYQQDGSGLANTVLVDTKTNSRVFTVENDCYGMFIFYFNTFSSYSSPYTVDVVVKPQLEIGSAATEFEPYAEPQTVTANIDGTVNGIISQHPKTLLMTDTEDITINCKYLRDIDTYIDNLVTDIALTGGN